MKKFLSLLLLLALTLGCFAAISFADTGFYAVEDFEGTHPVREGKVFAGWFTDSTCKTPFLKKSGSAYANFVDKDVLSVKAQLSAFSPDAAESDVRFVTTVPSLDLKDVGFKITLSGRTSEHRTKTVYERIIGQTVMADGSVNSTYYTPDGFSAASKFFMTFVVTAVPKTAFDEPFTVVPFWTTLDGAYVEGTAKTFTVRDGLNLLKPVVTVDAYAENNGFNNNYICGIDQFGRSFMPTTGTTGERDVGMFYFLWHGTSSKTCYNITELLKTNPDLVWNYTDHVDQYHYWGEPLYGYYQSMDSWVIRKHVDMFVNAGIDYLILDTTNAFTYFPEVNELCKVLTEYQEAGWKVPKIAFYTNSYSIRTMNSIYETIYKPGQWKSLWYCPDGTHPMIIGAQTPAQDKRIIGDPSYNPMPLSQEFLNFFDLRDTQWPFDPFKADGFPWIEWSYPQPVHNGVINVAVAEHPNLPFSSSYYNRNRNWGRGYNFSTHQNVASDMRLGTNFQSQWNTAINNKNVKSAFVTGWNEWIALKLNQVGTISYVDCFNEEFSRDIEPMKGGYEDAFYLQLCDNIRRFKGVRDAFKPADKATIDISKTDLSQWNNIRNVYYSTAQKVSRLGRGGRSVDSQIVYRYGRISNNIQSVKVTHDTGNVYFLVNCEKNVKTSTDPGFMNIFFNFGNLRLEGWEGYKYVIDGNGNLSSLDAQGNRTFIAKCKVNLSGKTVQYELPLSHFNVIPENVLGFYFKVADGVKDTANGFSDKEIMDYYQTGKVMPMGRLSYYYYFN